MGNNDNSQEHQLLIKQLVQDHMKEYIEALKKHDREKDNSFIYLENDTLHRLITYVTMQVDNHRYQDAMESEVDQSDFNEISTNLDTMITENQLVFEEIIDILKEEN